MIQSVITHRGTIYPWQCDHMGHMNVMWYTAKFDEASWQLLSRVGLSRARMQRESIGMAAVEQHLQYKRELRAGDAITVRSSVLEVNDKSVRVSHELRNDETGEVAATAVIVAVHIDAIARKALPLPEDVRARASHRKPRRRALLRRLFRIARNCHAQRVVFRGRSNYFTFAHHLQNRTAFPSANPSNFISCHRCKPTRHARLFNQFDSCTRFGHSLSSISGEIVPFARAASFDFISPVSDLNSLSSHAIAAACRPAQYGFIFTPLICRSKPFGSFT